MAVGSGALISPLSYVAVGREITYGTYATSTAGLNVLSASLKMTKETKVIEEIVTERTYRNSIQMGRVVEGDLEFYFSPMNLASNYLLQNGFGAAISDISSSTATGETVGGGGMTHVVSIGNFSATYASLCINMRKGDSSLAKVYQYTGLRVNELTFSAEIDDALKCSVALAGQDATILANDVSSALNTLNQKPLSFVTGRFSAELTSGSLTSSSFWHTQGFEFKLSNNLKSDSASRRIGTDTLQVLPPGPATFELKATIRFDTTTAYDAMMAGTRFSAEFEFIGQTMSGSKIPESVKLTFPYVLVSDAGDPEIGGPDEVLTSEVVFTVLRDPTSGGYAVKASVTNQTLTYA